MSAFDDIRFPLHISYGSSGGPRFSTDVVVVSSGAERRNRNWIDARCEYDASTGIQSQEDLHELIGFFRARAGRARGFLWKDWSDFTTAADGVSPPSAFDVILGVGDGSVGEFPLIKRYISGPSQHIRRITRPHDIHVAVAGRVLNNDEWSWDSVGHKIRFVHNPTGQITCGFEFEVPVRFDSDFLSVKLDDYMSGSATVPIVELRE